MLKKELSETFGLVKSKTKNNEFYSEKIDLESFKLNGKTIVCFCGNNTKSRDRATAYSFHCLNWLTGYKNLSSVTSFAFYYPNEQPLSQSFTPNPTFDYNKLAHLIFNSLIQDNGKLAPTETITKKLSDTLFFGHSMGGYIMNEVTSSLLKILENNHYSKSDIKTILKSITFVGYAPYKLIDEPATAVYITPAFDSMGSARLGYNLFRNKKDVLATNEKFNFKSKSSQIPDNIDFLESLQTKMADTQIICFECDNKLVAIPNLMFYDGIKEDHGLAGIIDYHTKNPYQTEAGELATKIIKMAFLNKFITKNLTAKKIYDLTKKQIDDTTKSNEQKEL